MRSSFAVNVLVAAVVALGAGAFSSCGSVTPASDGGAAGAVAGTSGGGTTGAAGTGGTTGVAGTTGTAGNSGGGAGGVANTGGRGGAGGAANTGGAGGAANTGGRGGAGAGPDGGVLTCRVDANDCPQGSTCACGGAGPVGMCTCHKNCTDTNQCGTLEPMCGCPGSTTGTARYCVNACFCSCG